jgi:ubiquitin C-terminal hydrolase
MNNNIIINILNNKILNQSYKFKLTYPHLTGLENLRQTCYMNSTLQCLSNIPELTDYLINCNIQYNNETHPLTISYKGLLFKLFFNNDGKKYINPRDLKTIIGDLNPLFQGDQAADSKDLLFFLIERLHSELNEQNKINNDNFDFNQLEKDSRDQNIMLNKFANEFITTHNSIISKNLYGITRSIMTCCECNITKYSFQTFNMQIFILKKLNDDKKAVLGQYKGKLNLLDLFIYSGNEEILDGENMIYCNTCQKLTVGKNKQDFYELPRVLIIVLNRGKNNADFNEEFDFPEKLDFTDQNIIINKNSIMKYYLASVITHLGESGSSGHFIAYIRKGLSDIFLCYNDASVCEVNIKDAMKEKISNKDNEKISPYILFYHCYD